MQYVGSDRLPVVFLMGPTASGKTDVAAQLSERFDVDLVSVDAAQVYRSMNIGTAKPDQHFLTKYPHQLIDIRDLRDTYSAADFVRDASLIIEQSHARGRVPILVGGTLFYFNALEKGLSKLPAADPVVRDEIDAEMTEFGPAHMHQLLAAVDPVFAKRLQPNDRQRVQRALEIYRTTGNPPSTVMVNRRGLDCPLIKLTLFTSDRRVLHQQIARRFQIMLETGLLEEVRSILDSSPDVISCASMRTVGYRQVIAYIQGQIDHQQMIDSSVAATRQLAKRQLTWLRQQSGVTWFEAGRQGALASVKAYLQHCPLMPAKIRGEPRTFSRLQISAKLLKN